VLRGFLEGFLRMSILPVEEEALEILEKEYVKALTPSTEHVKKAIRDAYRRLMQPSLESEFRTSLKQKADEEAIAVFAENLRQLLLSSPLGSKKILAIDPGYRSGCKIVCLDEKGELKKTDLIYVHEANRMSDSEYKIRSLVKEYGIETIAIGDGTAGRETEQFIKKLNLGLPVFLVNEDGASVYSASETAREEFPEQDITVRGSVSIGRRLMDPLAELVKIDPKSIGVGQYQHDVNQFRLKERLDQTVVSCVNNVGVNLNTASKHLLGYVSGIGATLAENIVKYRNEAGKFTSREQLLKVPRLGGKAYEPGLDPRSEIEQFEFANIYKIEDVHVGMIVPGSVTNLTRFGAFVDIGVKQDGLVHVSEIAHKYITDPGEVLKLGQKVNVKIMEVDVARKRIALSIKQTEEAPARETNSKFKTQHPKVKKEEAEMSVDDALSLLKKKFGK
jgi:competence ComEA-like helix-hairpin-helix protein